MKLRGMVFAGLAVAFLTPALAQDEKADAPVRAPFNPVEKAEVGDWIAFKQTRRMGDQEQSATSFMTVSKVDGDSVEVKSGVGGETRTFSKSKTPGAAELIGAPAETRTKDAKTTKDAKQTAGGKEFVCTLVEFRIDEARVTLESKIWFHPDVKVLGFARMRTKQVAEKAGLEIEIETLGYGTKDKTLWGMSLAEAEKAAGAVRDDDAPKTDAAPKKDDEPKKEKAPKAEKPKKGGVLDATVTCQVEDCPLESVLEMLIAQAGASIKLEFAKGADANKPVTINAQKITLADAFELAVAKAGYKYEALEGKIVVSPK